MPISLKKKYSQNFLIDQNIIKKIAKLVYSENLKILEIGPGDGKLTDKIILTNPSYLTIVEIDKDLIKILNEKYSKNKNIKVINANILDFEFINKYELIISNLPYNISSKILIKLSSIKNIPDTLVLMFQKEFAQRLLDEKLNSLNSLIRCFYEVRHNFNVSKNCFRPIPKVDSSVLTFKKIKNLIDSNEISDFVSFKRKLFSYKRKSLKNLLKKYNLKINLDLNLRVENLDIKDLIKLFRTINF